MAQTLLGWSRQPSGGQLVAMMRAMAWHRKAVGVLNAGDGAPPRCEADPAAGLEPVSLNTRCFSSPLR
jgi:hypothetical protein